MTRSSCNSHAVIGLGFGDEGKGVTVNSLCSFLANPLVIRYSGGQQAGHTVTLPDGTQHVFSNFGAGSFRGVPTYWSKYCTFDPVGVVCEMAILADKGVKPILYVDRKSPITTPYDKMYNQNSDAVKHGTCGVGVGATFQREEDFYSLTVGDLEFESVFMKKLEMAANYYDCPETYGAVVNEFLSACMVISQSVNITFVDNPPVKFDNFIFEGSQGLMLDQNIGYFPHVTRSNVGSKNILEMGYEPHVYLVTRAFQTRHGNGPMTNLGTSHRIKDNPHETNVTNEYQGKFKRSLLDLDQLLYAIQKDDYIRDTSNKTLIITCMDLVENALSYTVAGRVVSHLSEKAFADGIAEFLNIDRVFTTSSPSAIISR